MSPASPSTGLPSNVNESGAERSIRSPGRGGRRIRRPTAAVGRAGSSRCAAPRSCACRARRRTRGRSRCGGTTTRAARPRRCRGNRRSRRARAASAADRGRRVTSPWNWNSFTSRGPQCGHCEHERHYCALRNSIPVRAILSRWPERVNRRASGSPRRSARSRSWTCWPSTAPLGTNEIARRLGTTPSTVSRQLGTLAEAKLVEHVPRRGRYRLGHPARRARERGARPARRSRDRPAAPRVARRRRPARPRRSRSRAIPTRSPSTSSRPQHYVRGVAQLGRPSIAHATAAGKVMLAFGDARAAGGAAGLHGAHDRRPRRARGRARGDPRRAAGPPRTRSASSG